MRLTAAFSWLLLNERFGLQGFMGAGCILLGVVVSSVGATLSSRETADNDGDNV
jgi:drug/metabolite transporter (DMT)-like permease